MFCVISQSSFGGGYFITKGTCVLCGWKYCQADVAAVAVVAHHSDQYQ